MNFTNYNNTIQNLQWLHRDINKMKHNLTEKEFFDSIQDIFNYKLLKSHIPAQ